MENERIADYKLFEELGSGGYGYVYKAKHVKTNQFYAIKTSNFDDRTVQKEANILKLLTGGSRSPRGIPKYIDHGFSQNQNFLVMEILGKNLQSEQLNFNGCFSVGCVIEIGKQLIEILEYIHSKGILHRDIKPSQLLLSDNGLQIYLCDFGLASRYMKSNEHKEFKTNSKVKGSVSFASIHTHMGFKQSRRDDLETLFYTLASLRLGKLPWNKTIVGLEGPHKWSACLSSKLCYQGSLFSDFPLEFSRIFNYIKALKFDEKPDYYYIYTQLNKSAQNLKLTTTFDWVKRFGDKRKDSTAETAASLSEAGKINNFSSPGEKNRKGLLMRSKGRRGGLARCCVTNNNYKKAKKVRKEVFLDTEICEMPELGADFFQKLKAEETEKFDVKNQIRPYDNTEEGILPEFNNRMIL